MNVISRKFLKKVAPTDEDIISCRHCAFVIQDYGLEVKVLHATRTQHYKEADAAQFRCTRKWVEIEESEYYKLIDESLDIFNEEAASQNREMEALLLQFQEAQQDSLNVSQLGEETLPETETRVLAKSSSGVGGLRNTAIALNQRIESLKDRMDGTKRKIERVIGARGAVLQVKMADIQKFSGKLNGMLSTINIYLGSEERFHIISHGKPAPAETPIGMRQRMLFMDVECMIDIQDEGLTLDNISEFDEWIIQAGNLDRLLPEEKGLLALRLRKTPRHGHDDEDLINYLLLRNGERLYRYESNLTFERLLPLLADTKKIFFEVDGFSGERRPLRPGTREYAEAMDNADAEQLGYFKIALAVQGIFDRTRIFHPFQSAHTPNVLDWQNPSMRFIRDEEEVIVSNQYPPFREWLSMVNHDLALKSRIFGAFSRRRDLYSSDDLDPRKLSSRWQEYPPHEGVFPVEYHPSGCYCVRYHEEHGRRKNRVAFRLETKRPEFINLDSEAISDDALEFYSKDRDSRESHPSLAGKGLKLAIDLRKRERELEVRTRSIVGSNLEKMFGEKPTEEEVEFYLRCHKSKIRDFSPILESSEKIIHQIMRIAENRRRILRWKERNELLLSEESLSKIDESYNDTDCLGMFLIAPNRLKVYRSHCRGGFVTIDEYKNSASGWKLTDRDDWVSLPFNRRPKLLWLQVFGDTGEKMKKTPLTTTGYSGPVWAQFESLAINLAQGEQEHSAIAVASNRKTQSLDILFKSSEHQSDEQVKGLDISDTAIFRRKPLVCRIANDEAIIQMYDWSYGVQTNKFLEDNNLIWQNEDVSDFLRTRKMKADAFDQYRKRAVAFALDVGEAFKNFAYSRWRSKEFRAFRQEGGEPSLFETHLKTIPTPEFEWEHLGQCVWAMMIDAYSKGFENLGEAYPHGLTYGDIKRAVFETSVAGLIKKIQNPFRHSGYMTGTYSDKWSNVIEDQQYVYLKFTENEKIVTDSEWSDTQESR